MNLLRKIALVTASGFALGCHNVSGPATTATNYMLSNINGRTLPTFFSPIPEAPTILYGSLFLDGAGHAVLSEHRRESTGAEITYTTNFTYTITGGTIQFAVRCPANAMCVEPKGVFVNSHLLLDMTGGSNTIVYDYIVLMPD